MAQDWGDGMGPDEVVDVVLPCLDEAEALPWLLSRMPPWARPIVVDNGSTDGVPEEMARTQPHVRLLPTGGNIGYGAAANAGVAGRLTGADLVPALSAAGLSGDPALADALAAQATEHAQRWVAQDSLRGVVEQLGRPTVELPQAVGPIDVGCLFELSSRLEQHLRTEVAA